MALRRGRMRGREASWPGQDRKGGDPHTHVVEVCLTRAKSIGKAVSSQAEAEMEETTPRNEKMLHY